MNRPNLSKIIANFLHRVGRRPLPKKWSSATLLFIRSGFRLKRTVYEIGLGGIKVQLGEERPEVGERVMVVIEGVRRTLTVWAEVSWLNDKAECGLCFTELAHNEMVELLELQQSQVAVLP